MHMSLRRHSSFWFDDGSVVLSAEGMLFRVHRALLSRHSLVFRDMFALASPPQEGDKIEGCPVVVLHDSAEDVTALLSALYDGPSFKHNDSEDFKVVAGVLRMAAKYIIENLRTKALNHLSEAWPSTLEGWIAREQRAMAHFGLGNTGRCFPHPSLVIELARTVDAPMLLPAAFYDLSRYTFSQVFEEQNDESDSSGSDRSVPLSLEDTRKLAMGKEASHAAVNHAIRSMGPLRKPSPACRTAATCDRDFGELYDAVAQHYLFDPERGALDPLYVAGELESLNLREFSECNPCISALERTMAEERERLWRRIPAWFRLTGWDHL